MPCSSPACRSTASPHSSSSALVFFPLDDFDKRKSKELSSGAIASALTQKFGGDPGCVRRACSRRRRFAAWARSAASSCNVEDRGDLGPEALYAAVQEALGKAWQDQRLAGVFSSYQINVPQLDVNVDRVKVKQQGVKLTDVFQTLQVYLGSLYVNDFNRFGRTYRWSRRRMRRSARRSTTSCR